MMTSLCEGEKMKRVFAWGHGGQVIALVPDHGIVVVVQADPMIGEHGNGPWRMERANLNLAADFIGSLP
jgi:hypothetical protein